MTEPERDERIAQAYRALGSEQPAPALDAAILAAARRRGLRWPAPLAAAAALALAVGVALVVEREQTEKKEEVALAPQVIPAPAPSAPPPAAARERSADAGKRSEQALASAPAAPAAATAPAPGRSMSESAADRAPAAAGALMRSSPAKPAETPERWLERIAELREAGRHKEADESLAEFRRRHPDYRIAEEMRARVLPR
jgi:hypothetical protein